jgi:hypothetical protein
VAFWCPATKKDCDQPCRGSVCLRLTPRVLKPLRWRPCPKCGFEAVEGRQVKARIAYECEGCGARFWAPAVVIEVAADVLTEKTRPLRRGSRLI